MWSPFTSAKTSYNDHPTDVDRHVLDAYALLCNANRRGIQVPSDVVSTITPARAATKAGTLEGTLETKFWNAYGLLSSSIEPAERAPAHLQTHLLWCARDPIAGPVLLSRWGVCARQNDRVGQAASRGKGASRGGRRKTCHYPGGGYRRRRAAHPPGEPADGVSPAGPIDAPRR